MWNVRKFCLAELAVKPSVDESKSQSIVAPSMSLAISESFLSLASHPLHNVHGRHARDISREWVDRAAQQEGRGEKERGNP
jgi:hypothetical protein